MSTHYTCDRCGTPMLDGERGGLELPYPAGEAPRPPGQHLPGLDDGEISDVTSFSAVRTTRWYDLCQVCRESLREWVAEPLRESVR